MPNPVRMESSFTHTFVTASEGPLRHTFWNIDKLQLKGTINGSMLPQYMVLSVSFVCRKKLCVRSLGYIVGASPPTVKICVPWVTLWVRPPLCVSVQLVTLWVRPTPLCVSVRWVTLWVRTPCPYNGNTVGASLHAA